MTAVPKSMHTTPLAYRMSPQTLSEYVGQRHILSEGKLLRRMIEADRLSSLILFGPPGTGKTSIARVIASQTKAHFQAINAVTSGIAEIKAIIADTKNSIFNPEGRTCLFIDEIHHFNKAQQDALLPSVEEGIIILIGATTENPFFTVNKALLSRSTVLQLYPLESDDIRQILHNAIHNKERGYGQLSLQVAEDAIDFLSNIAQGDARVALNGLELAVMTTSPAESGKILITRDIVAECIQKKHINFDKNGEEHYDVISAFIKSMRGSDPDAAVHYLARALAAGEDINFLARRIVIAAAEDVGMANPQVLGIAVAAAQAVQMIGMPEARIILSEAAITVATSLKSNASYLAVDKALDDVHNRDIGTVPLHLHNAPAKGMAELGYGRGYEYSHDFPGAISSQRFLPEALDGVEYYRPTDRGYEKAIKERMAKIQKLRTDASNISRG